MDQEKKPKLLTKDFLFIFFLDLFFATGFGLLAAVIPLWLSDRFKADSSTIGLILGLSGIGTLIFRPFMGYAIDRWGRKNILHLALFLFGILNFCFLFAQNLLAILIIRFIQCIPFAAVTTCNVTIATDFMPAERRGEGFSYFTAAATLPMAIGPAIGLLLFKANWYWAFFGAGLLGLLCFILSLLIKIPLYKHQFKKLSIQSLFKKELLFISLIVAVGTSVVPGLASFLALYAKEISLNLDFLGVILFCYAICLFIVRVSGAKFINRVNPRISGCVALILLGIGVFIIGISHEIIGIAIGAILMGFGSGIMLPTMLMIASRIAPDNRGVSNSMVFLGSDIAQIIGSYGFGTIAKLVGSYGNSYIVFSGIEIIGLLIFLRFTIPHYEKDRKS
jgi:MFS family permease